MELKYSYQYFKLTGEQVDQLKRAEDTDSICQLGCWYIFTAPADDYVKRAAESFRRAIEKGSVEAKLHLANMYRLGDFGHVDMKEYKRLLGEAIAGGCQAAAMRYCRDIAYGVGCLPDIDAAIAEVKRWLDRIDNPDPRWFDTLGWMLYSKDDSNSEETNVLFQKAIDGGYIDSYTGLDNVSGAYEKGRAAGCGDCCVLLAEELDEKLDFVASEESKAVEDFSDDYDKKAFLKVNANDRARLEKEIVDLYNEAIGLGSAGGYYELGYMYLKGNYGHKSNLKKAWDFFKRGSELGNPLCFSMMAVMIEEGTAPKQYGYEDACLLRLKALRYGDDGQFMPVIDAFFNGDLEEYAEEIVQNYIPRYEAMEEEDGSVEPEDDDDYEDDDGRFDAWA